MKFTRIKLYKLPIDATYENVFDGWSSASKSHIENMRAYRAVIHTNYSSSHKEIVLNEPRSIKVTDGVATVTIPEDYFTLRDYNYAIFGNEEDTEIYAFFVNRITSQNDGVNPSATIDIEWDAWANNYPEMYAQDISANVCNTVERHYNRYLDATVQNRKFFADMKLPIQRSNPTTNNILMLPQYHDFEGENDEIIDGDGVVPLWYVFVLNTQVKTSDPALFDVQKSPFSFVYYPYGAFTKDGLKPLYVLDKGGYAMMSYWLPDYGVNNEVSITGFSCPQRLFLSDKTSYIEKCGITASVPFNYTLKSVDALDTERNVRGVRISIDQTATHADEIYFQDEFNVPALRRLTQYPVIVPGEVTTSKGYTYKMYIRDDFNYLMNTENSISKNDIIKNNVNSEIPFNFYPYKYKSMSLMGEELNLVAPYTNHYWQFRFSDSGMGLDCGLARVAGSNPSKYWATTDYFTAQKNFGVLFGQTQKSIFERNNSSRYMLQNLQNALGSATSAAIHERSDVVARKMGKNKKAKSTIARRRRGVESLVNFAGDMAMTMLNHQALMSDLGRQRQNFHIPTNFDDVNIKNLDFPFVYEHTFAEDDENIKADLWMCRTNGYVLDDWNDVLTNERIFYDYVKAEDFSPFYISNVADREALTDIITNGVRKWHITNFYKSAKYRDKARACNMNILNCEQNLVDSGYISWED